jgi:O-antigen/teichoic acid export membrane protein
VTRLRNIILANFGGQAWAALMGVAFVPVYVRILGIEAFGLIGFFLSLQAFFTVLDMGLSATLSRELARHQYAGSQANVQRDLVRTLEWLYWPTGLLIALGVYLLSGLIASQWLRPVSLSTEQAARAITLLGLSAGLQWPAGFYAGGFRGLERQVALNGLNAAFATLRNGGAVVVLLYVSPSLEAFLWWQVGVSALQSLVSGTTLWRLLPTGIGPRFRSERLREIHAFALGLAAIAILSFLLTQADRILLSTLLSLNEFGYYTLAVTVASALSVVVQPFFAALYPRYSGMVATGSEKKLVVLYHQSNQLLVVVVGAIASVMALFAEDLLQLWTNDPIIAAKSGVVLSILVIGTALNGLMNLPYALQLANGWTHLTLIQNMLSVLVFLPAIWWFGSNYGGPGAALVWVALNLSYLMIGIPLMHRRLLKNELRTWYLKDTIPIVVVAAAAATLARVMFPVTLVGITGAATLVAVGLTTLGITAFASPILRSWIVRQLLAKARAK